MRYTADTLSMGEIVNPQQTVEEARVWAHGFVQVRMSTGMSYLLDIQRLVDGRTAIGCKNTAERYRAAWGWYHRMSLTLLLKQLDTAVISAQALSQLESHCAALRAFPPGQAVSTGTATQSLPARTSGAVLARIASHSKRRGLGQLPGDWREQLVTACPAVELPALVLLLLTGCRPCELATGVIVTWRNDSVFAVIQGGKVTAENGQPRRVLKYSDGHPWLQLIAIKEACAPYSQLIRTNSKSLGRLVTRVTKRALSAVGAGISPYTARHQIAADLKSAGRTPEEIAAALGHRSTRSSSAYGARSQGKGSTHLPQNAVAERAIRVHPESDFIRLKVLSPTLSLCMRG